MKIKFQPWMVPNFCVMQMPPTKRQDGFKPAPSFALADVDRETLAQMCDDFRAEIFRKAGKSDPASPGGTPTPAQEEET